MGKEQYSVDQVREVDGIPLRISRRGKIKQFSQHRFKTLNLCHYDFQPRLGHMSIRDLPVNSAGEAPNQHKGILDLVSNVCGRLSQRSQALCVVQPLKRQALGTHRLGNARRQFRIESVELGLRPVSPGGRYTGAM